MLNLIKTYIATRLTRRQVKKQKKHREKLAAFSENGHFMDNCILISELHQALHKQGWDLHGHTPSMDFFVKEGTALRLLHCGAPDGKQFVIVSAYGYEWDLPQPVPMEGDV